MSEQPVLCPKCGAESTIGRLVAEESFTGVPDQLVKFVQRTFEFSCSKCGHSSFHPYRGLGHHGTIAKKKLRTLFCKTDAKRLRSALPIEERDAFTMTTEGKRIATAEEIARWQKLLTELRETS